MANWIQRFLNAIATHKADASAHHTKTGNDEVYGLFRSGLDANKPAAGVANRYYWAINTKILYRDTGAAWEETARGETAIRLAQLVEKAHGSLTGVTSDQHHPQAHTLASHTTKTHAELTGVTSDLHHPQIHTAASHSDIASSGANIDDAVAKKHAQNTDTDLSPAHKNAATGVHGVGAGTVAKKSDIAVDANLSAAAQDAITKKHAQAHTLASHSTKAHTELTGVTANQHHAQAHTLASHTTKAHSELTGVTSDQHHARQHDHSLAADGTPIAASGVPNLPASKITSGRIPLARLDTAVCSKTEADSKIAAHKGDALTITIPSATLRHSNDASRSIKTQVMTKLKEIKLEQDLPSFRVKFASKVSVDIGTEACQLYKNGTPIDGTLHENHGSSWVTFSHDLSGFVKNDLIQVWGKAGDPNNWIYAQEFRLYYNYGVVHTSQDP